jgi:hypothetical protein
MLGRIEAIPTEEHVIDSSISNRDPLYASIHGHGDAATPDMVYLFVFLSPIYPSPASPARSSPSSTATRSKSCIISTPNESGSVASTALKKAKRSATKLNKPPQH